LFKVKEKEEKMLKIKIDIQQSLNNNQIELKQQQLEDSIQEPRNLKKKN